MPETGKIKLVVGEDITILMLHNDQEADPKDLAEARVVLRTVNAPNGQLTARIEKANVPVELFGAGPVWVEPRPKGTEFPVRGHWRDRGAKNPWRKWYPPSWPNPGEEGV